LLRAGAARYNFPIRCAGNHPASLTPPAHPPARRASFDYFNKDAAPTRPACVRKRTAASGVTT
jgi:hypothetical protein